MVIVRAAADRVLHKHGAIAQIDCTEHRGKDAHEAHCRSLVERAITGFGRLDILVNNAAHQATIDSIEEISSEEWDRTMRTNLYAMFYLCRAAVPVMRSGGAIINTSSI